MALATPCLQGECNRYCYKSAGSGKLLGTCIRKYNDVGAVKLKIYSTTRSIANFMEECYKEIIPKQLNDLRFPGRKRELVI